MDASMQSAALAITGSSTTVVEEPETFEDLDALQGLGICATDVKKMKEAGFYTVESIVMNTKKVLCSVRGISEAKVEKMLEACRQKKNIGFMNGVEALQRRKNVIHITTGSKEVDKILQGGVETMSLTEIYGESRCGKTQLAFTMMVTCQLPLEEGGGSGKVMLLDTEGTFRPDRLLPIAERFGLDGNAVLQNVEFCRAYTTDQQMFMIEREIPKLIVTEGPFRMLVIDSVTALFRTDFQGRGELSERQQKLGKMLSLLTKIAEAYNIAVVLTNQVMSNPDGMASAFISDPKKPVGGHVMAHASTTRLSVKKGRGETRIIQIIDSPCLPPGEATYQITAAGVSDATD